MEVVMDIFGFIICYFSAGLVTNAISGYVMPAAQQASGFWINLLLVLLWPIYIIGLSGAFGACIRIGWKG